MSIGAAIAALLSLTLAAQSTPAASAPPPTPSAVLARAMARDRELRHWMEQYEPVVETYVRKLGPRTRSNDLYFLGRLNLHHEFRLGGGDSFDQKILFGRTRHGRALQSPRRIPIRFTAQGFSAMLFPFTEDADPASYAVRAAGFETVESTHCAVYDVAPRVADATGMFRGRLWIDPSSGAVVRFRGVFGEHWSPAFTYLHFDSRRAPAHAGFWIPATTIVREMDPSASPKLYGLRFQSITRVWDYRPKQSGGAGSIAPQLAKRSDAKTAAPPPPLLRAMQQEGLLARPGAAEQALDEIVSRLLGDRSTSPRIACRILLTLPVESFSIGNTIVVSRGLLELLPPGPSVAPVLAHEAAHILLGQTDVTVRSWPQPLFDHPGQFRALRVVHTAAEERQAETLADDLLQQAHFRAASDGWGQALAENAAFDEFLQPRFGSGWRVPGGFPTAKPVAPGDDAAIPSRWSIQPWTNELRTGDAIGTEFSPASNSVAAAGGKTTP